MRELFLLDGDEPTTRVAGACAVRADRPRGVLPREGRFHEGGQEGLPHLRGPDRVPGVRTDERRAVRHLGRSLRAGAPQAEEARRLSVQRRSSTESARASARASLISGRLTARPPTLNDRVRRRSSPRAAEPARGPRGRRGGAGQPRRGALAADRARGAGRASWRRSRTRVARRHRQQGRQRRPARRRVRRRLRGRAAVLDVVPRRRCAPGWRTSTSSAPTPSGSGCSTTTPARTPRRCWRCWPAPPTTPTPTCSARCCASGRR